MIIYFITDIKFPLKFYFPDSERSLVKFGQTANHSVVLRNRMFTYMMGKKYACVICGKMFSMKGNLSVHMLIHTGERPHQCELCLKVFRHRNSLNRHKRSRHMSDCPVQS